MVMNEYGVIVDYRDNAGHEFNQSSIVVGYGEESELVNYLLEQTKEKGYTLSLVMKIPGLWTLTELEEMADGKRTPPEGSSALFVDWDWIRSQNIPEEVKKAYARAKQRGADDP